MQIDTLQNLLVGGIVALIGILLILLVLFFIGECRSLKARRLEEERRAKEREAELKSHLDHPHKKEPLP